MRPTPKRPLIVLCVALLLGAVALQASSPALAAQREDLDIETILRIRD